MNRLQKFLRLGLATLLIGSLGACAVVPYPAAYYRSPPVYVQTYPGYVQPGGGLYYGPPPRHHGRWGDWH